MENVGILGQSRAFTLAYRGLFLILGIAGFLTLALIPIGKTFENTPSPFNAASRVLDQASLSATECLRQSGPKETCQAELQRLADVRAIVGVSQNGNLFIERTQIALMVDGMAKIGSASILIYVLSRIASWCTPARKPRSRKLPKNS